MPAFFSCCRVRVASALAMVLSMFSVWMLAAPIAAMAAVDVANDAHLAVARVPSHGVSAVIIATAKGETYLLTAARGWERKGWSRPVTLDVPNVKLLPNTAVKIMAVDWDLGVLLLRMSQGPMPRVCPLADVDHDYRSLVATGYDTMQQPTPPGPCVHDAIYKAAHGRTICTWEMTPNAGDGRVGGGLLDKRTGALIAIHIMNGGGNVTRRVTHSITWRWLKYFLTLKGYERFLPASTFPPRRAGDIVPPVSNPDNAAALFALSLIVGSIVHALRPVVLPAAALLLTAVVLRWWVGRLEKSPPPPRA